MYKSIKNSLSKRFELLIIEVISSVSAFFFGYILSHSEFNTLFFRNISILLIISELLVAFTSEKFGNILNRGYLKEFFATITHILFVWFVAIFLMYLFKLDTINLARSTLFLSFLIHLLFDYFSRITLKIILLKRNKKIKNISLVLITNKEDADFLIKNINSSYTNYYIKGIILLDDDKTKEINNILVVANKENMLSYLCQNEVDEIFLNLLDENLSRSLTASFTKMGFTIHRPIFYNATFETNIQKIANYNVITSAIRIISHYELFVKRAFDVFLSVIGLSFTGLIFIPVAILIKLSSKGSIFYKQKRVGKNGRIFNIYKFRTMYVDADKELISLQNKNEMSGQMFKIQNDPRIVKGIGSFLRKYSIDELPQFFNVLMGDMSIVGTRPPTVDEWKKYKPNHRVRLCIRPGLTGLWQVSGRNKIKSFEDVVFLDEKYINEWGYGLDIRIILKTIKVIFKGDGI